jgi:hypothetical protein
MATPKATFGLSDAQARVGFFLSVIAAGTFFWNIAAWKNTKDFNDEQLIKADQKQSEQVDKLVGSVDNLKVTVTELVTEMKVEREVRQRAGDFGPFPQQVKSGSKLTLNDLGIH